MLEEVWLTTQSNNTHSADLKAVAGGYALVMAERLLEPSRHRRLSYRRWWSLYDGLKGASFVAGCSWMPNHLAYQFLAIDLVLTNAAVSTFTGALDDSAN